MSGRYATPTSLRRALETRLKQQADTTGMDLNRLRRIAVFDRIAARLSAANEQWVLKGGTSLEFRLGLQARATKDLDLALAEEVGNGDGVRERLIDALTADVDRDSFEFAVQRPRPLQADAAGRPGWHFQVESTLAEKLFARCRLDVVLRATELTATEQITLPGVLAFANIPARSIESADPRQHFAEKLHAFTRDYDNRPNTRTKDLVDMVLLIENGLSADQPLLDVVHHVFAARATHPVPQTLPDPPPTWADNYPRLAQDITATEPGLASALDLLHIFWADTRNAGTHGHGRPLGATRRAASSTSAQLARTDFPSPNPQPDPSAKPAPRNDPRSQPSRRQQPRRPKK